MSSPESVSSRIASRGSSTSICSTSLRFFSPPENPSFTPRDRKLSSMCMRFIFSRTSPRNSKASTSGRPRCWRTALTAAFSR